MTRASRRVSEDGRFALPIEIRRRWNLTEGGIVGVIDLGDALLIVPSRRADLQLAIGQQLATPLRADEVSWLEA